MKRVKCYIASLLALAMLVSAMPANVLAETTESTGSSTELEAVELEGFSRLGESESNVKPREALIEQLYADDEEVTVIVEMEEAPVLDYFGMSSYASVDGENSGEAVSEFLTSEDAREFSDELIAAQDEIASEISDLQETGPARQAQEVEVVAQWSLLTNAMAVRVPYGLLSEIRQMDGVKRAYVQHVYERPETQTKSVDVSDPLYSFSLDMVDAEEAWAKGYTGKGTLVAVLDTGIDVIQDKSNGIVLGSHEVFSSDSFKSGNPEDGTDDWELRYNEATMTDFLADNDLYANTNPFTGGHVDYDNNALYKNLKVPFGYDYADEDVQTRPPADNVHGVHVAGTVAGYAETEEGEVKFSGVAPDAQILAMKVFPDQDGGAEEVSIVMALQDSLVLGADIINLSLGSDNGFADDDTMQHDIFARVEAAGVVLMTSAGNSAYSSAENNYEGETLAENPEISMVGSPAVYKSNLSVASIENTVNANNYLTYSIDGTEKEAFFMDANGTIIMHLEGKEYPVYLVGGVGTYDDFYNVGFDNGYNGGKTGIALVKRGEISFADKLSNAAQFHGTNSQGEAYGVVACIVYDSDPEGTELIGMSATGAAVDSCFISGKDGAAMAAALVDGKEVKIQIKSGVKTVENSAANQMSSFTSWGAGPALELKPEITAPGGNIWSSVIDGSSTSNEDYTGTYEMMSGTSMAAPHMTGIGALVRQRVHTDAAFDGVAAQQIGDIVSQLLVSTAVPQKDTNGVYYSPRVQGAGLVSASAAVETPVYISVDGQNVGKLELGDDIDETGSYDIAFDLHNVSNKDVMYSVSVTLMKPETGVVDSRWGERDIMTASDTVIATVDLGTVTAKAGTEPTTFKGSVSLSAEQKQAIKDEFPNGTYVEGYVMLTDKSGQNPNLGLPMLSFFGDWTKAPIFETANWFDYEAEEGFWEQETTWEGGVNLLGSYLMVGSSGYDVFTPGENLFVKEGEEQKVYWQDNITISPDGNGYFDTFDELALYQLRDARVLIVEVKNADDGTLYYRGTGACVSKTVYNATYGFPLPTSLYYNMSWDGTDMNGNVLPSGTNCIYTITAYGDGDYSMAGEVYDEYYEKDVTDYEAIVPGELEPLFNGHEMDKTGDVISFHVTVDTEAPKLQNNAVTFYEENGRTYIKGAVYDTDGSIASVEVTPIVQQAYKEGYGDPSYVQSGGDFNNSFYCETVFDAGKKTLEFTADVTEYVHENESYPGENNLYDFTWTGNIMVSCGDYGANDRTYMIKVDSTEGIILSHTSALLHPGEEFELSVNNNLEGDEPIVRTSSNPEVATVDEYGMVTAVAPGQTIITVSKGGAEAICVVAVEERPTEVLDFRLSIDKFEGLKPDGQATVRVVDLYPADVEIDEIIWSVEEDEDYADQYAAGLISVEKNAIDALSGNLYLTASGSEEVLIPGGHAVLTVTINGVSRSMEVTWDDLYETRDQDDLVSSESMQDQVIYVNQGETAQFGAQYRQRGLHNVGDVDTELTGLQLDGPTFFGQDSEYTAKLVNDEGYALPDTIKIYIVYSYGYEYEMTSPINYGYGYDYDPATGDIYIAHAPTGDTKLRIVAEGTASEGNPAGEMSGTVYERPDGLFGPFDWALTEGTGTLATIEVTDAYGNTREVAEYTPAEPGVSYIRATTKNGGARAADGNMYVDFAVVSLPIKADTLTLDTHNVELMVGDSKAVTAALSPEPTLDAGKELIWRSFDESVATVDANGTITGVASGYAYIKVVTKADTAVSSYVRVHVLSTDAEGVIINRESATLTAAGETLQLTAAVLPANATNKNVTWNSSDETVATVDANGLVTAVSNGTATITVTTEDGGFTATCTVTVKIPEKEEDKPSKPSGTISLGTGTNQNAAVSNDVSASKSAPNTSDVGTMNLYLELILTFAGTWMISISRKRRVRR